MKSPVPTGTLVNPKHVPGDSVETPVETPVKTGERILELIKANPDTTLAAVARTMAKSLIAVERASAKWVKEGRLRRVGPRKSGHWEVLK